MANIKVDHSKFESRAKAIDDYISSLKSKMKQAEALIDALSSSWEGADYQEYKKKWEELTKSDSVYKNLIKELENYAKFLRHAAEKYKDTQTDAVNRANRLPNY